MTHEQLAEAMAKLSERVDRCEAMAERIHQLQLALQRLDEMKEQQAGTSSSVAAH